MKIDKALILFLILAIVSAFFYVTQRLSTDASLFDGVDVALGRVINKVFIGQDKPTTLVFVGDILLARDIERKIQTFGIDYPFASIKTIFTDAYVLGNFEATIPKIHLPTPDFTTRFSVSPVNLEALVRAKITHLSLANNHSLDFGEADYRHTKEQLSLYGFEAFGHGETVSTSSITYLTLGEDTLAIVGIGCVNAYPKESDWLPVIKKANEGSNFVIVYVHWGDEYQLVHNQAQEQFAHALIDAGVDLIVGHHPHVVQDIQIYQDKLIFYSLGNFVFDQYFSPEVQVGLALKLKLTNGQPVITLVSVSSINSKGQPQLMSVEDSQAFLESLAHRSDRRLTTSITSGIIEI